MGSGSIQVQGLSVRYSDGTAALNNVSFTLNAGESLALVGANGAGKTSLLLALVGLAPLESGVIRVDGLVLQAKTRALIRGRIGLVFQNPDDQLFMPTLYDDLAFGLRNKGLAAQQIDEQVRKTLSELQIPHLASRTPLKLSGGEKRLAALATVLVMNPSVMLLDEPTAFLDHSARRTLIWRLRALKQSKIITTHDLSFAAEVCERVLALKGGVIIEQGQTMDLLYKKSVMEACLLEALRPCDSQADSLG
ncbi:MAG: energy-coupling factor ABC transporter ATP-binding protein [Spirochaetaceae bacterium]|jgi:cobalt/nickel transport system ATP-binding protein|nr:energy-coupling factor ABC transporter ATP-binding protein [Spirochaetaceae bacterium]